jgi:hypothetical protein
MNDIASALTGSVAADGQTPMTGPLNMNSNKIANLANGTINGDAVNLTQFNTPTFGGAATFNSTITVVGNGTFSGTGFVKLPNGTTAQRPASYTVGAVRYNTTLQQFEGYSTYSGQTISSITNSSLTATLTTTTAHNLVNGTYITVIGATPAAYNGTYAITVVDGTSFTYTMAADPAGPATVVGSYLVGKWSQIGGGATGNGGDQVFVENNQTVTASYQIPTGKNASTVSPITINSGVVVTVPSGSRWVVL